MLDSCCQQVIVIEDDNDIVEGDSNLAVRGREQRSMRRSFSLANCESMASMNSNNISNDIISAVPAMSSKEVYYAVRRRSRAMSSGSLMSNSTGPITQMIESEAPESGSEQICDRAIVAVPKPTESAEFSSFSNRHLVSAQSQSHLKAARLRMRITELVQRNRKLERQLAALTKDTAKLRDVVQAGDC